jgi:hypothetical protein
LFLFVQDLQGDNTGLEARSRRWNMTDDFGGAAVRSVNSSFQQSAQDLLQNQIWTQNFSTGALAANVKQTVDSAKSRQESLSAAQEEITNLKNRFQVMKDARDKVVV